MPENKPILHELYVFSEWKPEPEYLQKPDNILPENISALWRWLKFFGPKKSLIDSVTAHKERQQKWLMALGDEGKVIAVLTDNILEIRTKRSEYATIAARTTVTRDGYPQWRKLAWSPDCSFLALAYGVGTISFLDLTASNLFNIPTDCSRPGGLECTDNTHAVSEIIFMPLRVKDTKWNWEVLVVTFDGRLRGYLVSQSEGFKLHHSFRFPGGVAAAAYCEPHATLYVAGVPRAPHKDLLSPLGAGLSAWRILNDEPFYTLSVVSDELEARLAADRFQLYMPMLFSKNLNFIVRMVASPDNSKLVCVHCNGDISIWRLPLLKAVQYFRLAEQPEHALQSPLRPEQSAKDAALYCPADVNWWSAEELIVSRFSGAVSVCGVHDLANVLGRKPEFFQGSPQVTCAYNGAFMALECESKVLPGRKSHGDESMEVVRAEVETDDSVLEVTKELFKSVLYAITDIETFQPKPKKITVVSRIYRLLGVKSTTPTELFSRKIESGNYSEALVLADTFGLDSDLVYQQQWRKNPVSTDAIQNYLSKVSKKIWAVHQCVDRLPESLPAATELLTFGLQLAQQQILHEINKDLSEEQWKTADDIILEDLNSYTSELLRCRHVMLFYQERLRLYEAILSCEKSTYVKDEYDRLRSHSIVRSAMEVAREGRVEALACLWPHVRSARLQRAVLERLPETLPPPRYVHLLPAARPSAQDKSPARAAPSDRAHDWCKKEIFRPIWSSNWSEESSPETESSSDGDGDSEITKWYDKRAREIEERSGLVSHALEFARAGEAAGARGLDALLFHLRTLDTLVYELYREGVGLRDVEKMTPLETCQMLVDASTLDTFVSDLNKYVIPFLRRYEVLTQNSYTYVDGLADLLEAISVDDLSHILVVLQAQHSLNLNLRVHLELAERCLMAYRGTEHLHMACDVLATILRETDGSISNDELLSRVGELERLVAAGERAGRRGVSLPLRQLRDIACEPARTRLLLARVARALPTPRDQKPTQQEWEDLLNDILELQSTLFECITVAECYEIFASALLTSGEPASIRLAADVLSCGPAARGDRVVGFDRTVQLISNASKEYFNSASSLDDPALELAKCCLQLVDDEHAVIQQELDLIAALPILSAFNQTMLPIQVRLCQDRLKIIDECLKLDPNAYLASHKLLKLASLLRIAGNDEQLREGLVLERVCECALAAGAAGGTAAAASARRLAALRHAPAASLMARVASHAPAHAHQDRATRAFLLAAALTFAPAAELPDILRARQKLELEGLQQIGAALKEHSHLHTRWPSTDDEFSDAITTPVIEKKDLVAPEQTEKKVPLFNYLLDTFQSKFTANAGKSSGGEDAPDRRVHCQEFYGGLYPALAVSAAYYRYDRFAAPDALTDQGVGQAMLKWFYIQNCLDDGGSKNFEADVVQKYAEEILYKDTALSVACLLRSSPSPLLARQAGRAGVAAVMYAALVECNAPELRDNVYLARPRTMAEKTLTSNNGSEEQLAIIRQCIDKLTGMGEVDKIRALGVHVNGLLFNADGDYRQEIIYRLARSGDKESVQLACALAAKHGLDSLDVWLQAAAQDVARAPADTLPEPRAPDAYTRIREKLWPAVRGTDHAALIQLFSVLRCVDERPQVFGLTAADHIKLLKKAKAASSELDYKLLVEERGEALAQHVVSIMRPESAGLLSKLLRTLPPALKLPVAVSTLYTTWLINYFFTEGGALSNKKWMQQYRQCASYFHKLSGAELRRFVAATCFSPQALQRVPWNTRHLMILQTADYCQQEQENEVKFNKTEQSWAQVGQELSRWARFLDNFHSDSVQALVQHSDVPRDQIWPELEMSHGDPEAVCEAAARLVLRGMRPAALASLLHCLHAPPVPSVLAAALTSVTAGDVETLIIRLTQYHKEGVKIPDDLLEQALEKASELGLAPHKQLSLRALRPRARSGDDLAELAHSTLDLFRAEWPACDYVQQLTGTQLCESEVRADTFSRLLQDSSSAARRHALVHALRVWPRTTLEGYSLHAHFLRRLRGELPGSEEALELMKLLLQQPVLVTEEVVWLSQNVDRHTVLYTIWIILLSKCERSEQLLYDLVMKFKETIPQLLIKDDLIKEILEQGMFIKLVSTPLYPFIVNFVMSAEMSSGEPTHMFSVQWAVTELVQANHIAEAGHLQMAALGVPLGLRSFSQSVLYCKNMCK